MSKSKSRLWPAELFATMQVLLAIAGIVANPVAAHEDGPLAFDDKFNFRVASYSVQNADTDISVADSDTGIGVAYSFRDDFGGDEKVTTPRIDLGYRFNDRHRLDFAYFEVDRGGREVLKLDVDLGDKTYSIGETLETDLNYEVLRFVYGYSFYRTDQIELGIGAGLHFTTYEFGYQLSDGTRNDSVEATGPLPMFNIRLSYALTPDWAVHYLAETFYFEFEDTYKGSFTTSEIDIEYRINRYFALGAGLSRFSTDLDADDGDWKGSIVDSHRALMAYANFFL